VSLASFDPYNFKECPVNLDVIKEKLALEVRPGRRGQNWREADINQSEQP
jgi:hypothetical protein